MPMDHVPIRMHGRGGGRGWFRSWLPFLASSLVHVAALGMFIQFGRPGAISLSGRGTGEAMVIIGRFLEGEAAGGGGGGEDAIAIALSTVAAGEAPNDDVSDLPAEKDSPPDAEAPVPVPREVSRTERTAQSTPRPRVNAAPLDADAELEPPPEWAAAPPRSVVEEDRPRRTGPVRQASSAETVPRGSGRGAGGSGQGKGIGSGAGADAVGFFGLQARARTIVYVIDASSSMESHAAMSRAIVELEASLDALLPTTKFGIVFFNSAPAVLATSDGRPQAFVNTPRNRRIARQFIESVVPDAGSDRLQGLLAALPLNPDAIFLLTDAGDPPLAAADLEAFRRQNRRKAPVHVVEFGVGAQLVRENFLTRLARQATGSYCYVDVASDDDLQ